MKVRQTYDGLRLRLLCPSVVECMYIESDGSYVFCATADIPSDAEAEARSQHIEEPEPLPVDTEKPESLEQVSRIGTLWCKSGTEHHLV